MNTLKLEKDLDTFLKLLPKLEPQEWIGAAIILKVEVDVLDVITNKKHPRDAEEILEDMIDKFLNLNKRRRKTYLKLLRDAVK